MKKQDFPILFRMFYKFETIGGLVLIFWLGMSIYVTTINYSNYKTFINDYSKRLILGKMVVTYYKGSSARSPGRSLGGYIIGNNSPLNCNDCIQIGIGSSSTNYKGSEYYDDKYINKYVGDTVLVWYTNDFKYKQIVPLKTKNDLLEFEFFIRKKGIKTLININLFIIILFFIFRFFRKYYQKKYNITTEEYKQYVKIAYKK